MISIVQNFICTKPERLEVLEAQLPAIGEVFGDCEFFVNYNSESNFDKVYQLYKKYIPKLNFYNDLTPAWAPTTLALANQIETPYLIYLYEDTQVHVNKTKIWECIDEFVSEGCDYLLLTKLEKYLRPEYKNGGVMWNGATAPPYNKLKHGYWYFGKYAPHKRVSTDAVYRTKWYTERLEEFILKGESCTHSIPIRDKRKPNFYEGYYDFANGTYRFSDMKFYIPNEVIISEFDTIKQNS